MATEPVLTIVGNLTDEVSLRFLPNGAAVANFSIASTPRTKNTQTDQWEDGETLYVRASAWRSLAENVSESLVKGSRVIVTGRLKSRSYEKDGVKKTSLEIDVDEIGPSLQYAIARPVKVSKGANQQQSAPANTGWDDSSAPPF